MWKKCDVRPYLLLATVLDPCFLFKKLFMVGPYLLSLLDVGIALQGLITLVYISGQMSVENLGCPAFSSATDGA